MQHVKTPIKMAEIGGTGRGTLFDAEGEMVIIGINAGCGQEIAQAVNAYDALVAERDELKVQRDALARACEAFVGLYPNMRTSHTDIGKANEMARAAIALVEASQ